MLELIDGLPERVVGIRAQGELSSDDYKKVLIPAVDAALAKNDKIRLLYVLGPEFDGLTMGAMWDDTRVGFAHINRWEKIAVVTDKDWIRHSVDIFGYLIPGEVKGFTVADEADAQSWVSS